MVNLFLSLFSPKAIESSLVAKWEQSHLSLIQPYLVMNVCVSGYVGAAPRPPAPPTVPGQNSTAKEDTDDTTIGRDSLVLYGRSLVLTFQPAEQLFSHRVSHYYTMSLRKIITGF